MEIQILDDVDGKKWNSILKNYDFNVFHSYEWMNLKKNVKFIVAQENGQIKGGYPIFYQKLFGLKILNANSYPFGETDKIRAEILSIFKKLPATIKLIKADFPTMRKEELFSNAGFKLIPAKTLVIDLTQPLEKIWINITKGIRDNIKKSERCNLSFGLVEKNDIKAMKEFCEKIMREQNFDKYIMKHIREHMEKGIGEFYFVKHVDKLIVLAHVLNSDLILIEDACFFDRRYKSFQPLSFLRWNLIKIAKQNGFRYLIVWAGFESSFSKNSRFPKVREHNARWCNLETSGILTNRTSLLWLIKILKNPRPLTRFYFSFAK
jgi:hypothetical protein